MSRLFPKVRNSCIEIMEKLMSLPCGQAFLEPTDDKVPNYHNIIKHPIDLRTIAKRMQNNEYTSISQWDKDMNLIWNNAEKYYTKNSYIGILANQLHIHYDKEYKKIKAPQIAKWSRAVFSYKAKLENLFEKAPPVIGAFAQKSGIPGESLKGFSEEELNVFIRMSLYLQNPQDSKKMAQIIKFYQPDLNIEKGKVEIDVNDLSTQSLYSLRDYVTLRLAEMNISYPK
ncbi:Bromodomain containing protein [Histomonas meleagridis]|uniref:Bromodomain containing protein n=1 Tax=Histomonas meleagridis TaxID=135588 RepID=UPI00355AC2FF|nr:Bromodomain containing protein [Histomonas meleagridis]KAH0801823.1 Bromodomain containing protein [Histomonas meleagridis]